MADKKEELLLPEAVINLPVIKSLIEASGQKDLISLTDFSDNYELLNNTIEICTKLKDLIDTNIKASIEEHYLATGDTSVSSSKYKFVYVPGSSRESFNSKALKSEDPETYKKYVKVSTVAPSLRTYKIEAPKEEDK